MAEISSSRPLPAAAPTTRPALVNSADLAVKLLQPLEGMLAPGETAKAEVVTAREVAQSFQLLLKLTLGNGRQATVQASSPNPVAQGSTLAVTALSETRLAIAIQGGDTRLLGSLDPKQFPPGTLLQGKVASSEQIPRSGAQALYRVVVNLLNTPLAGNRLSVETPLQLPVGSLLTAQVQGSQKLSFLPLSGRLDQLVLGQQLSTQQARQGSLEGLFKALQGIAQQDELPDELRTGIDKLLGMLPDAKQLGSASGLAKAMEQSGVFLEAKLLGGLSQQLPQDLKANLLRLVTQLLPNLPGSLPLSTANAGSALAQALPAFARNALGAFGLASPRQQAMSFPLPSRLLQSMEEEADLETLLKLAAAAVSRLQTHQLSSLAQSQITPEGNLLTTWQLELPMRDQQDIVPLQIKLQREEDGNDSQKEQKETLWRIDLAFDLDPLGPLQVQAQLLRGSLSSELWAERADTARLIDRELDNLRQRLTSAGLEVGELNCRQGMPPRGTKTHLEQRWVDETA